MNRMTRSLGVVIVALVLAIAVFSSTAAQAGWWYKANPFYDFYYTDRNDGSLAWQLGHLWLNGNSYASAAFNCAFKVLGTRGWDKKITVYIYDKDDAVFRDHWDVNGYAPYFVPNIIYLNARGWWYTDGLDISKVKEYAGIVAHETSHVLFNNWTKAPQWVKNGQHLNYYYTLITESLAWYTCDVAYQYGPRFPLDRIKTEIKDYVDRLGYIKTWYGIPDTYLNWQNFTDDVQSMVLWELRGVGYYLTNGQYNNASLGKLLNRLRSQASEPGFYLLSPDTDNTWRYVEYAFKYSYGYMANAGDVFGDGASTNYLQGRWYAWIGVNIK